MAVCLDDARDDSRIGVVILTGKSFISRTVQTPNGNRLQMTISSINMICTVNNLEPRYLQRSAEVAHSVLHL